MDKKKILIGLGVVALIGGILYFYNKSKSSQSDSSSSDSSAGTSAGTSARTPPTEEDAKIPPTKVLETRKEKRKACGRKPIGGKKKELWQKCVNEGGTSEFIGDFDEFEESYLDFDNNFDISF